MNQPVHQRAYDAWKAPAMPKRTTDCNVATFDPAFKAALRGRIIVGFTQVGATDEVGLCIPVLVLDDGSTLELVRDHTRAEGGRAVLLDKDGAEVGECWGH